MTEDAPPPSALFRIDPKTAEMDMMRLVLTIADLLRETLERQAIARMERGTVSADQISAMSEAFEKMNTKIDQLCAEAGLSRNELDLDLGPFGSLLGRNGPSPPDDRGVKHRPANPS